MPRTLEAHSSYDAQLRRRRRPSIQRRQFLRRSAAETPPTFNSEKAVTSHPRGLEGLPLMHLLHLLSPDAPLPLMHLYP